MIGTGMDTLIAASERRHLRTAMAAGVEEAAQPPLAVAHHDDRLRAHHRGEEIMRARDLAFEADEQPSGAEDVLHLEIEDVGIGEDLAPHAEDAFRRAIVDQGFDLAEHRHGQNTS